jgi:hypothetical protein
MTTVDSLLLDAKQAILEEQHRRFQSLHKEGRLQEAMHQFQVTITCASDLLTESLRVLEHTLDTHGHESRRADPPTPE